MRNKYELFPFQILQFISYELDNNLVDEFVSSIRSEDSGFDKNEFYLKTAFLMGSFILPKYLIKTFDS